MKKLVIAVLLAIAATLSVAACTELERELAHCAIIAEDLERLECYDRLAQSLGIGRAQSPEIVVYSTDWRTHTLEQARRAAVYGRSIKNLSWTALRSLWTIDEQGSLTAPGGREPLVAVRTPLLRIVKFAWRGAREYRPPLTDDFLTGNMSPNVLIVDVRLPGFSSRSHIGSHAVILQGDLVLQPRHRGTHSSIMSAWWPRFPAHIVFLTYSFDVRTLDPNAPFILRVIPAGGGEGITFPIDVTQLGAGGIR